MGPPNSLQCLQTTLPFCRMILWSFSTKYNIQKLNLLSKTDISTTAWINTCRTNKFANGNIFVLCVFWNKKYTFTYTFDLCGRVGNKLFFFRSISGNKTTFFGLTFQICESLPLSKWTFEPILKVWSLLLANSKVNYSSNHFSSTSNLH